MATVELNPIFDFAVRAQRREKAGQWFKAVEWYQKALSCLPNIYGSDQPLKHIMAPYQSAGSFTRKHAARLYAALGRCLMKAGRMEDSLLAGTAARGLDAACAIAPRCLPAHRPECDARFNSVLGPGEEKTALQSHLTLIVVTHYVNGLVRFKSLSPPSTKLIDATYGSLIKVFGDEIGDCPQILCYDRPSLESAREKTYMEGLERFSRQHGFDLHVYDRIGLYAVLEDIAPRVATPYTLFVEHDWLFQSPPIRLNAMIGDMNRNTRINAVRFNKRENQIDGQDYILKVDESKGHYPLLRTSSHSNNPSVFRTEKLRDEWLPVCRQALRRVAGELGGSAFGVEEILFRRHAEDIRRLGFDEAHRSWGTYVFGKAGDPARVVHLGE